MRSFAGWELDYRAAFGKTALPEKKLPKVDRTRWMTYPQSVTEGCSEEQK